MSVLPRYRTYFYSVLNVTSFRVIKFVSKFLFIAEVQSKRP